MDLGLTGKTALVTGAHRGTGFIIAKQLSDEGANVVIHGFEQAEAEAAAEKITGAVAVSGDICSDDGTAQLLSMMQTKNLSCDILVNNYGQADAGRWTTLSSQDWIDSYQKNTLSIMRMVQAMSPAMIDNKYGRIINLGTIGSTRPNKVMPHYYAAKGALANMTVSLAKELSGTGITVNLVSPGLIRTPEVEASFLKKAQQAGWGDTFDDAEAEISAHFFPNFVGRIATREEVAQVILFLAGNGASFINGQNIRVDGGAVDIV